MVFYKTSRGIALDTALFLCQEVFMPVQKGEYIMRVKCYLLTTFFAITSLVHASSRSSSSNGALQELEQSISFNSFQTAVKSTDGYTALQQRVHPLTGDETDTPVDRDPFYAFRTFHKALEAQNPGLCDTLSPDFFAAAGKSIARKWVSEAAFTYSFTDIWNALVYSKEPEVVRFLKEHPIREGDTLYAYVPEAEERRPAPSITISPVALDGVATHFPHRYKRTQ